MIIILGKKTSMNSDGPAGDKVRVHGGANLIRGMMVELVMFKFQL